MAIVFAILMIITTIIIVRFYGKHRQRSQWRASTLSQQQRLYLTKNFPLYANMPNQLQLKLEGLIVHFMAEKKFYGGMYKDNSKNSHHDVDTASLVITDNMKLLIAAQACILVVNKPNRWFDTLSTIIVYPAVFKSRIQKREGQIHSDHEESRSGESWMRGPVILAWDHTVEGARNAADGHNVVIHEFAHQLDAQTGVTDGAPLLDRDQQDRQWARIFQEAFTRHVAATKAGQDTLIDAYGATNPAEFFSVCTETFFEQSNALKQAEPDLYQQLEKYFKLDPANWVAHQ